MMIVVFVDLPSWFMIVPFTLQHKVHHHHLGKTHILSGFASWTSAKLGERSITVLVNYSLLNPSLWLFMFWMLFQLGCDGDNRLIHLMCNVVYVQRMSKVLLSCSEQKLDDRRYIQPPFQLRVATRSPYFSPVIQVLAILFFFIMCVQISINIAEDSF